ncbi:MAG: histidine kinase [Bacteroidales bacterium]
MQKKIQFILSGLWNLALFILIYLLPLSIRAQQAPLQPGDFANISFQHLTTANGLSYNGVNDHCTDKAGNLWIATGNGLNMFNGKTVDKYFAASYPAMQNSNVIHVTCDSGDCIWALTAGGNVTMLDDKRVMHRVGIYHDGKFIKTRWVLNSLQGGIILLTSDGLYTFNRNLPLAPEDSVTVKHFSRMTVKGFEQWQEKGFRQIFRYDDDNYIFLLEDLFFKVNFKTKRLEKQYSFPHCTALVNWGNNELLVCDRSTNEVKSIDLSTEKVTFPFKNLHDQFGQPVGALFYFAEKTGADEYIFTSYTAGIYIFNRRTQKIHNHKHSLVDPTSIGTNTQTTITSDRNNRVFITCNPNGISYFNTNDFIGTQTVFTDNKGNGYDSYVAGIATKDNNTYYIGTAEGLLEWKRKTNQTTFINFSGKDGMPMLLKEIVYSIVIDSSKRIWASTFSQGIFVFNEQLKLVKHIVNNKRGKYTVKLRQARILVNGPDGFIWAGGGNGICKINPNTFEVENFNTGPLVKLDSFYCSPLYFSDNDNLWIGTGQSGAFHYNLATKELKLITTSNGLVSNQIFCFGKDASGSLYIGTMGGLNILFPGGRVKTITQKEGLLIDRVEGLLPDKYNRMWIGNDIGLACYNVKDSTISTFDERYGLSIYGFRLGSYFQTPNGEFIFGTPKGIQYFRPESLFGKKIILNARISRIETSRMTSNITGTTTFRLAPSDNLVTFYFGTVDFTPHLRSFYEYRLEGADKEWVNVADQNAVRYNSLPPGKYVFKVRISSDNKHWQNADNEVVIIISAAFYETWWFKLLFIILGLVIFVIVINHFRNRQIQKTREKEDKQRAAVELWENKQKAAESRLQSLRLQMNPHFLFNALNSIQQMILANEEMVATRYLSRFSKLLRTVLVHSDKEFISLKEEIDILSMYIELESVRFKDSFSYSISCDEEIETDEIKIPTLLIQPFVENAIWHGLMHKEGDRQLKIHFAEVRDFLECTIEDNGIGRKKSQEIKDSFGKYKSHSGKGISVSDERVKTLVNMSGNHGSLRINDLATGSGESRGTQVIIYFPI